VQMLGMNASGVATFRNALTLGGSITSANSAGVWTGTPGSLQLVMRAGDVAPVTGGVVSGFGSPAVFDDGRTAVTASLVVGGAITAANNQAVWVGTPGNLQLAFRKGDQVPGEPAGVVLNGVGIQRAYGNRLTFFISVIGNGVGPTNDRAVFTWSDATGLVTVAREGNVAPGTGGALFNTVGNSSPLGFGALPSLGPNGEVAFFATLTGTGVTTTNDTGIWLRDAGGLKLVAREGDVIDLDPGAGADLATISGLTIVEDIRSPGMGYAAIDSTGGLTWLATFTDGRSAVMYTPTPEPGTVLGIAAGALALGAAVRRRLRRADRAAA
jgi:hypothetical protein